MNEGTLKPSSRYFRPLTLLLLLLSLPVIVGSAQERALPQFSAYPGGRIFNGKPAPPILNSARARQFRTMIRTQARKGPNFAGHYTVVIWGCGTDCRGFAIVNARTGKVLFHPRIKYVMGGPSQEEDRLQFRIDSRLLIISGFVTGQKHYEEEGKFFYELRNEQFNLVRKAPMEQAAQP